MGGLELLGFLALLIGVIGIIVLVKSRNKSDRQWVILKTEVDVQKLPMLRPFDKLKTQHEQGFLYSPNG